MNLQPKDRKDFMIESGIEKTGLYNLIKTGYNTLGLRTFFTSGPEESRAWTIEKNFNAADAAGVIHTDFKKNLSKLKQFHVMTLLNIKVLMSVKMKEG